MVEYDGTGICFYQDDMGNYNDSTRNECFHNCSLMSCPNFEICGNDKLPECLLSCHGGICLLCEMHFGVSLEKKNHETPQQCPGCREDFSHLYKLPQCTHQLCTSCIRIIHYERLGGISNRNNKCPLCIPKDLWEKYL